ncbi:MAG: heat shock protein Hsp20 [Actinomycetia bacterium]|nr:heat shock protein Hsp20 [Actinomycetes bacterium]
MSQVMPERSSRTPDRFQPSTDIDPLDRVRSLIDQTLGGEIASMLTEVRAFTPPVDIEETDDAYVVEADLPGVQREDIDIELEGNELLVSGEVKQRDGRFRRRTRRVGRFELRVVLPHGVDSSGVDAKLDHGVLTVRVPKAEKAQRRKIDVKS